MDALRLPFDHGTDSAVLRRTAQRVLASWQSPDLVDDTLLVITELVQNVVQHTGDGGELTLSRSPEAVLIEVSDRSFDMPRVYPPDARRLGGRGLLVVSAMCRDWGSRRTIAGKVVWAELALA
jgi:anti-sigma regulatory factor (Ser/Thr protein kinase)